MKAQPTTKQLIEMLYERLPELFDRAAAQPAPVQEPVAWGVFEGNLHDMFFSRTEADYMAYLKGAHAEVRPLYTTPPAAQRQWVGLTDEEIEKACVPLGAAMLSFTEVARVIEAKLKEKNT